jgi:uncharacterized protein YndB with AHSA1/START domain
VREPLTIAGMKRSIVAALVLISGLATAQTTQPALDLSAIDWCVGGVWRAEGKWANGNPFKAEARFETILGGAHIQATSITFDETGSEKPRDVAIFSVANGQLVQHTFNADGQSRKSTASRDDEDNLVFAWTKPNKDGTETELKQIITRVSDDDCRQKIMMHIKGEWHTLIDVAWKRSRS